MTHVVTCNDDTVRDWLVNLLGGVVNGNAAAEEIAIQAYRAVHYRTADFGELAALAFEKTTNSSWEDLTEYEQQFYINLFVNALPDPTPNTEERRP